MSYSTICFSSRRSLLKELVIAKTAKYIWSTNEVNLGKLQSMKIFLRTWQENWLVNNPVKFPTAQLSTYKGDHLNSVRNRLLDGSTDSFEAVSLFYFSLASWVSPEEPNDG